MVKSQKELFEIEQDNVVEENTKPKQKKPKKEMTADDKAALI